MISNILLSDFCSNNYTLFQMGLNCNFCSSFNRITLSTSQFVARSPAVNYVIIQVSKKQDLSLLLVRLQAASSGQDFSHELSSFEHHRLLSMKFEHLNSSV